MIRIISIILIHLLQFIYSECSELSQDDCEYWSEYCQWNGDTNQCEDLGGGGGGDSDYGPYEVVTYTQNDGMLDSPLYADVTIYYPSEFEGSLGSIVFGAGWGGDQGSMADWAYINLQPAQPMTSPCNPRVVHNRKGLSVANRLRTHGSELNNAKGVESTPHTFLLEKYRPRRVKFDHDSHNDKHWCKTDQPSHRSHYVKTSLNHEPEH